MRPKYGTWIKTKRIVLFLLLFACLLAAGVFIENIYFKILLIVTSIPFGYVGFLLLLSYRALSESGGNYQELVHNAIASRVPAQDRADVLDIGAGSGSLSIKVAKKGKGYLVKAIDYWGSDWEYSLQQCIENATIESVNDQVEFIKASASGLPFEDEAFDVVVSCLTFHEVKDTENKALVLSEALRVLKRGGHFVFFDLFHDEKLFGNFDRLIEGLQKDHVEITEAASYKELFPSSPKILFHKKVLGHGVLMSGEKR